MSHPEAVLILHILQIGDRYRETICKRRAHLSQHSTPSYIIHEVYGKCKPRHNPLRISFRRRAAAYRPFDGFLTPVLTLNGSDRCEKSKQKTFKPLIIKDLKVFLM